MALHIVVQMDDASRWRAQVHPDDGRTDLFRDGRRQACAWYCPHGEWTRVRPRSERVLRVLDKVADSLRRLGWTPSDPADDCGSASR